MAHLLGGKSAAVVPVATPPAPAPAPAGGSKGSAVTSAPTRTTAASPSPSSPPAAPVRRAITAGALTIPKERPADHQRRRRRRGWCCGCCGVPPADFFELLNPTDFDRLVALRRAMHVPYDAANPTHVRSLLQLWCLAYPALAKHAAPRSRAWRLLGFQNDDPSTDFRGPGYFALHAMLYFAATHTDLFRDVAVAGRVYPWAAAAINVIHIVKFHLGLADDGELAPVFVRIKPARRIVANFVSLFVAYEHVVEKIFCCCMKLVDVLWRGLMLSPVPRERARRRSSIFGGRPGTAPLSAAAIAAAAPKPATTTPAPRPPPPPPPPATPGTRDTTSLLPAPAASPAASGGADAVASIFADAGGGDAADGGDRAPALEPTLPTAPAPEPEPELVVRPQPSIEELTALLDFPKIIVVVRNRLDAALLAWRPESSVWAQFEYALMHGADGVRFKRTPVLL